MVIDIAIIAIGVLVFVVPELLRRARRPPPAEERRLLDGRRQRLVRDQRRRAAERGGPTGTHGSGCPWCGFPIR